MLKTRELKTSGLDEDQGSVEGNIKMDRDTLQRSPIPTCPACGSEHTKTFLNKCRDLLHGCPGEWSLAECERCGIVSISPFPTMAEIKSFYPSDYVPYNSGRNLKKGSLGELMKKILISPYVMRYGNPGLSCAPFGNRRLLEIGCGSGTFLREMSNLGWEATGIDISPIAVAEARANAPTATVHEGVIEDVCLSGEFDLIVMIHVLEHVPNPHATLKRCFDLLTASGALLVSIPNLGSLEANLFSRRWSGLDTPRHLMHFRERVLRRTFGECGFEVE